MANTKGMQNQSEQNSVLYVTEILLYLENLYVSKNFGMSEKIFSPKMVHWQNFFWRRGGVGGRSSKKILSGKIFWH
jgi:hypothetical protein